VLVPAIGENGMVRAAILHGVTGYDSIEFLDSHARPQRPVYAIQRVHRDIAAKHLHASKENVK
jgi:hypothetical protein